MFSLIGQDFLKTMIIIPTYYQRMNKGKNVSQISLRRTIQMSKLHNKPAVKAKYMYTVGEGDWSSWCWDERHIKDWGKDFKKYWSFFDKAIIVFDPTEGLKAPSERRRLMLDKVSHKLVVRMLYDMDEKKFIKDDFSKVVDRARK